MISLNSLQLAIWRLVNDALFCNGTEQDLMEKSQDHVVEVAKFDLRSDVMRMALLVSIFAIIFWALTRFLQNWASRKDGQLNQQSKIKMLEKRSLGPRAALHLVEIPGKRVLIAQTATSLTALAETSHFDLKEASKAQFQEN